MADPRRLPPHLIVRPPRLRHGDAAKMAQLLKEYGIPCTPWQINLLERLEQASIDEQFREIIRPAPGRS